MSEFYNFDTDVVRRAKSGDHNALTRILYQCERSLTPVVASKIPYQYRSLMSADDILQETSLRVQQRISSLESDSPSGLFAWVGRIAENVLHTQLRALRAKKRGGGRHRVLDAKDGRKENFAIIDTALTPGQSMELEEVVLAVNARLDDLSSSKRKAVELHYVDKKSVAETATMLGKTPAAIRNALDQALDFLRDAMGGSSKWFRRK